MSEVVSGAENNLDFHLDDESGQLWAYLQPGDNALPRSADEFMTQLKDAGYGGFFILEQAIQDLVAGQTSSEKIEIVVAERRDADVSIRIDDKLMQAFITITPAYGGEAVSKDQIYLSLRKAAIVEGILAEKIPLLLKAGQADDELIAQGTEPVHGENAYLENLLPVVKGRHPKVNKDGTVNLRELGQFIVVKPGDALMRKVPFSYGSSGVNIHGQVITPRKGEDIQLNALPGTRLSADDPNLLVARIAGQPLSYEDGIEVDPTLSVESVNLTTGNIDFDGSVYVTGNVIAGMSIKTTGDIFIEGSVETASLEAGGDITIKKGFIGRGSVRDEAGQYNNNVASARCGGRFAAKFIENVLVTAGREVVIGDLISHSEVMAGENIISGVENGRGRVWGGKCEAGYLFKANSIGSSADVKTVIVAGNVDGMKEHFLEMGEEEKQKMADRDKMQALLNKFDSPDTGKQLAIDSIRKTLEMNASELKSLASEKQELIKTYKNRLTAKVVAEKEIFNGVELRIGGQRLDITDHKGPGTYRVEGKDIKKY